MDQLAPTAESYAPPQPKFDHAISQKENDFAQLVAAGGDNIQSMVAVSIITAKDALLLTDLTLKKMANRLTESPRILERTNYYRLLHQASLSLTVERLEQEAASIAYSDVAGLYHPTGEPITNPHDLPRYLRAAIKEFVIDKDGIPRHKFHDKLKGMQMVGDLGGHFNEAHAAKAPQVNISLGGGAPEPPTIDVTPTPTPKNPLD